MDKPNKVAVGLSGGVDSSVAAALLVEAGYDVTGLTMRIWNGSEPTQEGCRHGCFGPGEEEDIAVCERLCKQLGIPYRVVDLADEYERTVVEYFRAEYLKGRTPNPCVLCNHVMKFGFLLDRARAGGLSFDAFATGHYARIQKREGRPCLRMARDASKDQSYFLYRLGPETLSEVLFPLGDTTKAEVRELALRMGLEAAEKPESQDFVSGGDYSAIFAGRESPPGEIVDQDGRVLGTHTGIYKYTIGQRRGLGVSVGPEPLYVRALDPERNRVVVGRNDGLFADGLEARNALGSRPGWKNVRRPRPNTPESHARSGGNPRLRNRGASDVRRGAARRRPRTVRRLLRPGRVRPGRRNH